MRTNEVKLHSIAATLAAIAVVLFSTTPRSVGAAEGDAFTPLTLLPGTKVLAAAQAFSDAYVAENLLLPQRPDRHHPEYATRALGIRTFVDFDLGQTVRVAAFRHIQRQTIDIITEANLIFSDSPDFKQPVATVKVQHTEKPSGVTLASFAPVTARYVRWQVSKLMPGGSPNVGGRLMEFYTGGDPEPTPSHIGFEVHTVQIVTRSGKGPVQPLKVTLNSPYAEPLKAVVRVAGQEPRPFEIQFGSQTLEYTIPATEDARTANITVEVGGQVVATHTAKLRPARPLTIYVLAHSHTDIGYTTVQTDIEEKQVNNLVTAMAEARRTANYPEGARFVWNVEVAWAADLFLQRLSPKVRAEFFDAVKHGRVSVNGMYLNELTGLCRPEELIRLFRYATQIGERTGVPVDSAMISDVPGYTWGTVTAMAQAGIRYFSVGENGNYDRVGTVGVEWENQPRWWVGPDGKSKVLAWSPFQGYSASHRYGWLSSKYVEDVCAALDARDYPYDIAYVRWSGHLGDNSIPDFRLSDDVKAWNATHLSPRFVLASTHEAFHAFEKRYGDKLPVVRGDWTPYWEDGAATSAAETAMNRITSERLAQAETLWAMLNPALYPAKQFEEAWNNVLLYSEHTWGASISVIDPAAAFTLDQWNIKQTYATTANLQSRQLLPAAAQSRTTFPPPAFESKPAMPTAVSPKQLAPGAMPVADWDDTPMQVDIFNTTSWPRSELVLIPRELTGRGETAVDDQGQPVPAQGMSGRELAVAVRDLPPFSGRRYTISKAAKAPKIPGALKVSGTTLENDKLRVSVDAKTGGIVELHAAGVAANLADTSKGEALNNYLYFNGDNPASAQGNAPVKITVRDRGPLVASLVIEADAPGCHKLLREIRLTADADYVEVFDTVDKKRFETPSYYAKEGKESINFVFPFNVPDGEMRLDAPLSVFRPEADQIPGACKNSLPIGRWADIANHEFGVTWVTLDAPMIEIGELSGILLNSVTNPEAWRKKIERSQRLYAWVMNNHWHTNYRAYQEGPVVFRFVLRPHRGSTDDAEASRFATAFSQPLVSVPARGPAPSTTPLLRVEPADVLVSGLKPSDDGKAWIVRLFGSGPNAASAKLTWPQGNPKRIWLSDTSEKPIHKISGEIAVPAKGLVTLRAELPR